MALYRPHIRKSVREEVEKRAQKNENGQFLDANTGLPIEGNYDIGHKVGHEYRNSLKEAEEKGIRLIDANPRKGAEGLNIAFLHPKSTIGVLTELCENPDKTPGSSCC